MCVCVCVCVCMCIHINIYAKLNIYTTKLGILDVGYSHLLAITDAKRSLSLSLSLALSLSLLLSLSLSLSLSLTHTHTHIHTHTQSFNHVLDPWLSVTNSFTLTQARLRGCTHSTQLKIIRNTSTSTTTTTSSPSSAAAYIFRHDAVRNTLGTH